MPPKGKKKRASLRLDTQSGQIKESDNASDVPVTPQGPPVRQVVEVVDEASIPEAIEILKKDAEEIEEVAETIEEHVEEHQAEAEESSEPMHEEVAEETKGSVESLFTKATGTSVGTPEITVVTKRDKSLGVWIGALVGIVLAIGLSLILLVKGPSTLPSMFAKPTPTPTSTPAPTPTPVVSVNKKDVKIAVINGGGTPGAGSKMKAFLESKGYVVASVTNASEYTHTETEIDVKAGKDALAAVLKEDLKSDYTLASSTGTVDVASSVDAQVIVGK